MDVCRCRFWDHLLRVSDLENHDEYGLGTMAGQFYIEFLLALSIILVNQLIVRRIQSAVRKKEGPAYFAFLLKWHSVRVGFLLAAVTAIIMMNKVDPMLFTGIFIAFYLGTKLYNLYRYGTTNR